MAVILTPSGGMSVRGSTYKPPTRRTWSGGGSVSAPAYAPPEPNVTIGAGQVFIDGQGFSVKPSEQAAFIRERTGGVGQSAQVAITFAEEQATIEAKKQAAIEAEVSRTPTEVERLAPQLDSVMVGVVQPTDFQRAKDWMAITPSPQERLAKTRVVKRAAPTFRKIEKKGERASFILGRSRRTISESLRPTEKQKRVALEKSDKTYSEAVKKYNEEVKKLEQETKKFSSKYLKGGLTTSGYNAAIKEQDKLKVKAGSLESTRKGLENYETERKEVVKQFDIKVKKVPIVQRFAQSVWVGALSAPIGIAELGIGLATKPEETITGTITGIRQLPKAIVKKPIETITELGVSAVIYGLATRAITGAVSKAGLIKPTPKVTQSVSIGKAVRVKKDPSGLSLWRVEGKVITKLKHPKTGKTIETFKTQTFSDTITSQTKTGAVKAYSKTWAASIRKGDIGVALGRVPKVKIKAGLTKARGEVTLNPTDVENLYRGTGTFGIQEVGKIKILKAPKKVVTKVRLKTGQEYEALSNVWAKQIGSVKRVDILKPPKKPVVAVISGREYTSVYRSLTDIYGKKGADLIIRSRESGVTKAYVPEKGTLFLKGFEPKPIKFKAKVSEYKPTAFDTSVKPTKATQQFQNLIGGVPEKAVAEISARTITKSIGETLSRKAKPVSVPKAIVKVTPITRTIQYLSPAAITVTKQKLKAKGRLAQKGLSQLGVKSDLRAEESYVLGINNAFTQALGTKQTQVQAPRLSTVQAPSFVPAIPTLATPKVPVFTFPFEKKETKVESKRKKIEQAKIRKQQRAYQASVGAVSLGITMTKKQLAKYQKQFTGLELRPVIRNNVSKKKSKRKNIGVSYSNSNNFQTKFNKVFQL